jgi:outer membrane protein assembly factor BamB
LRRHLVPLLVVLVVAAARLTIALMERYEFLMEHYFNAMLGFQFLCMAAVLVLGVWFFFLSGYPKPLRIGTALGLAGVTAAALATIDQIEFDGQMNPKVRFKWEPSPEDQLARHLADAGPATGGAVLAVGPSDSPRFRGPAGDGKTPGVALAADWDKAQPKVVWRHPVGSGHAGVAVAGNSAVTIEQREGDEVVVCYDRATGKERWSYAYSARFKQSEPMGGDGPRTTPAVANDAVVTLGARGDLVCVEAASGKLRWRVNVLDDNGATVAEWGVSGSPAVHGNLVIVNPGVNPNENKTQAVAAYDLATGKRVWANGSKAAAYASPQVLTLGGKEQVVVFDAAGLGGYDPADGSELWRYPWKTDMDMNTAQPVAVGPDRLFVSSEKSNGGAVVEVRKEGDKWATKEVWKTRALSARFCSPIVVGNHIYGLTDGRLICVDASNGRRVWAEGDYGNGQLTLAGDVFVISTERGSVVLVAADPTEFRELGRTEVFTARTWNVPALAGNQFFLRNHREMACLELPTK